MQYRFDGIAALLPMTSIAHYRITSKLGEGGMGAVYRATDTKLNREVAVKVLPDSFAADPDRLARFSREAQILASLNHPNIATIHGVEEGALIMELVEGSTLAGPVSEEDALPLILQLIDALEYAHDKGIVHRDLKPANIKLTPEGRVKVLDFGLAKALTSDSAASDPATSPTLTMRATVAGVIVGTAAYMSPEQARGQGVDRRADIWAFGAVVYELLTGKPVFLGATVSDTLASVLRQEIDLSPAPPRFRRLLRACLERDPRRRMRDIGDARLLLEEPVAPAPPPRPPSRLPWIAAALAFLAAAVFGFAFWRATRSAGRPLTRFRVELGPDAVDGGQMTALLSPDGRRILYRAHTPNGFVLAIRALDQPSATLLPGTEDTTFAFFSPDGAWIGFFAGGKLKKIPASGGAPFTICDASDPHGAAWLPGGTIVGSFAAFSLARVSDAGGATQPLYKDLDFARYPQALPGGNILFTSAPVGTLDFDNAAIEVVSLATGARRTVLRGGYSGRYLPTGHLLYVHSGTIWAVRFNPSRAETQGAAVPLLEGISSFAVDGAGHFDFSSDGTFVYVTGASYAAEQRIAFMDANGAIQPIPGLSGTCLRISPDGKRLAFADKGDLSVHDFGRDITTRITFDPAASNRAPAWSPDGRYVTYAGAGGIWWTRSDGSGQPVRILEGKPPPIPWSMTAGEGPHGLRLAFHRQADQGTQRDIYVLPLDVSDPDRPVPGKPEVFVSNPENDVDPMLSPDGRWMAYGSQEEAEILNRQLYVRRYRPGSPAGGGLWQIPGAAGAIPVWSADGKQIFFRNASGQIMVVDCIASGDSMSIGKPRLWSPTPIIVTSNFQDFDMLPGARRAVVVALPDEAKGGAVNTHVNILLDFFDEVKRRLP